MTESAEQEKILKIYVMRNCPHCRKALEFLNRNCIPFREIDMENTDPETEAKVIEINGGDDWVVPTLEYAGNWRPGAVYDEESFAAGLRKLGIHVNPVSGM